MEFLIWILFAHFVADFMLQRHAWAMAKSSDNVALAKHVGTYAVVMTAAAVPLLGLSVPLLLFGVVMLVSHFAIDYVSSRVNKRLFAADRIHDFFVVVGLDQFLHYVVLLLSLYLLVT